MKSPFQIIAPMMMFFTTAIAQAQPGMTGAWERDTENAKVVRIVTDNHFSEAAYDLTGKKFISTRGGSWKLNGNTLSETIEFNTANTAQVGTTITTDLKTEADRFSTTDDNGKTLEWKRTDDGTPGKLAGAWLITGRMVDGAQHSITPGARRTMKILSGTRFQWIAYNAETKEFFGTGGGTYTTANGKYVENLEFFSRDNNRVGASLSFDFDLENGNWRHQGLSSKGDKIDEVWTKREKIGL